MSAAAAHNLAECLVIALTSIPVGMLVLLPSTSDQYAVAGAALAALLGGLYALSRRKPYISVALTLISSAGVGAMGPGFTVGLIHVIYPSLAAHLNAELTWHFFAMAGLFYGLGGWALVHAIIVRWEAHADNLASHAFRCLDPDHDDNKDS
jgi:hypothetical protein